MERDRLTWGVEVASSLWPKRTLTIIHVVLNDSFLINAQLSKVWLYHRLYNHSPISENCTISRFLVFSGYHNNQGYLNLSGDSANILKTHCILALLD